MLNRILNEKSMSKNIFSFIGNFILSLVLYNLGQTTTIPFYIIIIIVCLFFIRSLLSGYCILKLLKH